MEYLFLDCWLAKVRALLRKDGTLIQRDAIICIYWSTKKLEIWGFPEAGHSLHIIGYHSSLLMHRLLPWKSICACIRIYFHLPSWPLDQNLMSVYQKNKQTNKKKSGEVTCLLRKKKYCSPKGDEGPSQHVEKLGKYKNIYGTRSWWY